MPPLFQKVVILGVGQIGASIGMNLVGQRLAREVVGVGRHRPNLQQALRRRAIHRIGSTKDLAGADLIILAAPVVAIRESLKSLPKGPLIVDVGSTKSSIVKEAERHGLRFVGSHPIAGTEKRGSIGGDKNLFRGRLCVITPSRLASPKEIKSTESFWKRLGAKTVPMSAVEHDRLFAMTSHLPHAVAFSLSHLAGRRLSRKDSAFVFTSFKDATRVALSPIEMWRDIFSENKVAVLKALDELLAELRTLRSLVNSKKERGLVSFLTQAQKSRQELS